MKINSRITESHSRFSSIKTFRMAGNTKKEKEIYQLAMLSNGRLCLYRMLLLTSTLSEFINDERCFCLFGHHFKEISVMKLFPLIIQGKMYPWRKLEHINSERDYFYVSFIIGIGIMSIPYGSGFWYKSAFLSSISRGTVFAFVLMQRLLKSNNPTYLQCVRISSLGVTISGRLTNTLINYFGSLLEGFCYFDGILTKFLSKATLRFSTR